MLDCYATVWFDSRWERRFFSENARTPIQKAEQMLRETEWIQNSSMDEAKLHYVIKIALEALLWAQEQIDERS
jgi:hypothetical protein